MSIRDLFDGSCRGMDRPPRQWYGSARRRLDDTHQSVPDQASLVLGRIRVQPRTPNVVEMQLVRASGPQTRRHDGRVFPSVERINCADPGNPTMKATLAKPPSKPTPARDKGAVGGRHQFLVGPSMCSITCPCGYEGDFLEFRETPVGGELPRDHYQCPKCRRAWAVETGSSRIGWSGMVLPGKTRLVEIPSRL